MYVCLTSFFVLINIYCTSPIYSLDLVPFHQQSVLLQFNLGSQFSIAAKNHDAYPCTGLSLKL